MTGVRFLWFIENYRSVVVIGNTLDSKSKVLRSIRSGPVVLSTSFLIVCLLGQGYSLGIFIGSTPNLAIIVVIALIRIRLNGCFLLGGISIMVLQRLGKPLAGRRVWLEGSSPSPSVLQLFQVLLVQ